MSNYVKQVIVMRTDLGMRKGKMIAQGSHASMAFLTDIFRGKDGIPLGGGATRFDNAVLSGEAMQWVWGKFTKICVRVDSEDELMAVYESASKDADVYALSLITDAGKTEFHGVPTRTCLAIGPHYNEIVDRHTSHLRLL